jgi:hypothetical protein
MKTHPFTTPLAASFGAALLLTSACSNKDKVVQVQPAPVQETVMVQPTPTVQPQVVQPTLVPQVVAVVTPVPVLASPTPTPVAPAVPPATSVVVNPLTAPSWTDIKDLTFEQRGDFVAGLGRLVAQTDSEIAELNAKRAAMTTDTKDWDFAMKGLVDAQAYLKSMAADVANTESDMWIQEKEKCEAAWTSVQDAYDKVLHSTVAP